MTDIYTQNGGFDGCGKGMLRRKSYTRKSYTRSGSKKRVASAHVPSTCIKDRGPKGQGRNPRRLARFSGKMHLSAFGYSTHKPVLERKKALDKAVNKFGELPVLRHLNLARNYQADDAIGHKSSRIMAEDIAYLSKKHKITLSKQGSRKSSKKTSRKTSKKSRKSRNN